MQKLPEAATSIGMNRIVIANQVNIFKAQCEILLYMRGKHALHMATCRLGI